MLTEDQARDMLIKARKRGATRDYAIIGIDDDASKNPFDAQQAPPTGTGELNTIYARINGNPDPQTVYYDPALDMRILAHGARVLIEWIDGQPWVLGADKVFLTQQQNGAPLPTHNLPIPVHDHTNTDAGGALGANTVDTTQLVDGAVTTVKLDDLAVTSGKLATDAVTNAKVANDAINTNEIVNGAITSAKIATDAVKPTQTDGLTGASVAIVTQTASNTFAQIPYTLSANTRLYYDGTNIRSAYTYTSNNNGAITIGATATVIITSPDMAGLVDTSNSRLLINFTCNGAGSVTGDSFNFYWEYNYDNAGAEAWRLFDTYPPAGAISFYRKQIIIGTYFDIHSFPANFDAGDTTVTWGYAGTYKIRLSANRSTGTGNFSISPSGAGFNNVNFFSIIEA